MKATWTDSDQHSAEIQQIEYEKGTTAPRSKLPLSSKLHGSQESFSCHFLIRWLSSFLFKQGNVHCLLLCLAVTFKSWYRKENYRLTQCPWKVLCLCLGVGSCGSATSEWLCWEKYGENTEVIENCAFAGMWSEEMAFSLLGQPLPSIAGTPASNLSKREKRWVDGRNTKRLFFLEEIEVLVQHA